MFWSGLRSTMAKLRRIYTSALGGDKRMCWSDGRSATAAAPEYRGNRKMTMLTQTHPGPSILLYTTEVNLKKVDISPIPAACGRCNVVDRLDSDAVDILALRNNPGTPTWFAHPETTRHKRIGKACGPRDITLGPRICPPPPRTVFFSISLFQSLYESCYCCRRALKHGVPGKQWLEYPLAAGAAVDGRALPARPR